MPGLREVPGAGIVRTSIVSTGGFAMAAVLATAFPDLLARPVAAADIGLFVGGMVAFGLAFARAIDRSRTERVELTPLFLLNGDGVPTGVRRALLGAFALQVVVALTTSSIRLYTSVDFGVLVPLLGLGLCGLWGARHGTYPPRDP